MPASSARDRNVLSTPYITSASGASLARMALLTIDPASPDFRMFTVTPLACSKAALTSSDIAKESCVITVNSVTAGLGEPVGGRPAEADGDGLVVGVVQAATARASTNNVRFITTPGECESRPAGLTRRLPKRGRARVGLTGQALAPVEALRRSTDRRGRPLSRQLPTRSGATRT